MDIDITVVTAVFSAMFVAQTALYTYLLLRLRRRASLTSVKPHTSRESQVTERRESTGSTGEDRPRTSRASQTSRSTSQGFGDVRVNESVLKVLRLLNEGPLSAREVSRGLGLSREHTARLLKRMADSGLVAREGKPYKYRITPWGEAVQRGAGNPESS